MVMDKTSECVRHVIVVSESMIRVYVKNRHIYMNM